MPEIWAFCDRCTRWFYCPKQQRERAFTCPACASPTTVTREGRPPHPTKAADELAASEQQRAGA